MDYDGVEEAVNIDLRLGDCLDVLPTIATGSIDAVITDPPYPCIKRDYGYWTEAEWWALIVEGVIPEVRRILKPTGSAVFILQPNSEHVGQMRGWLWEFMAWVCREWNMVQDVWWWNYAALPVGGAITDGLTRGSLKACVWMGPSNCYRVQENVLNEPSESARNNAERYKDRELILNSPSGRHVNYHKSTTAWKNRGGVTPFNVLPITNGYTADGAWSYGHGAGTPLELLDWWLRYIVPPGGVVVDPFLGSGTTAVAAIKQGKHCIGCDKVPEYIAIAEKRIKEAQLQMVMPLVIA